MRLLVSVTSAREAAAALAGGADIIDVKNPAEGSLGAPTPQVVEAVVAAVGRRAPVSVALGDLPDLPGTAALAARGAAAAGASLVKVGLRGVREDDRAVALMRAVAGAVPAGVLVVAAAYADAARLPDPPLAPQRLVAVAARAGVGGCLLDTAVKDGRGLLDWLAPGALAAFARAAHAAGLTAALAGSVGPDALPVLRAAGADVVGVRSAACADGRRLGAVDAAQVRRLHAICHAS